MSIKYDDAIKPDAEKTKVIKEAVHIVFEIICDSQVEYRKQHGPVKSPYQERMDILINFINNFVKIGAKAMDMSDKEIAIALTVLLGTYQESMNQGSETQVKI